MKYENINEIHEIINNFGSLLSC